MNASLFHKAVAAGDATKVKFLINIGQQARVNQANKEGFTALQQSCNDGLIDVVHVLLNHGADINATGRKDRTALHLAATGGYADIVELLIKSFADLTIKNGEGMLAEDVAKTEEIANLLSAAHAEQKAKSGQSNRKKSVNSSEEWSQNFTSLPAGSRNSMVSNSSSDSGVFTEESVTSCRGGVSSDSRLSAPSWRNGSNRGGSVGDTRAMEVLNELEEGHEQRSSSFTAAHTTTTEKPRPKLRRSNSARLPSRRARRSTQAGRHNNISEELSALDLSRVASSRDSVDGAAAARQCLSSNASKNIGRNEPSSYRSTSIDSPNNDLDICVVARDVDSGCVSTQKCQTYEARSQPRSVADTVVCYAGGDEGCVVDEPDEILATTSGRTLREIPDQPVRKMELRRGWDDAELYRRSLSRKTRSGSRRRTIEVGQVSHENQRPPVNHHDNYSSYNNNNNNNNNQGILSRKHGSFRGMRMNAREPEPNPNFSADIASLNQKTCNTITAYAELDTETEKFYKSRQELNRLKQLHYPVGVCYEDYNENADYGDSANVYRDPCNNIPGYEETLSRLRYGSERARRPASRQVSHV